MAELVEWCTWDINDNYISNLCWYNQVFTVSWCHVFIAVFLQRVMKLVSWTASWRRCSPALLSGGREDHGKQVHTLTQESKHADNTKLADDSKLIILVELLISVIFLSRHTCGTHTVHCVWETYRHSVSVTTHNRLCFSLCVCLVHLLRGTEAGGCGRSLWTQQQGGRANYPLSGTSTQKRGRVPRIGVGSMIL